MQNDQASLIALAVQGESEALGDILKQNGDLVAVFVSQSFPQRFGSQVSAEDVLQSIYADAFLAIRKTRLASVDEFIAWIKTIARHNIRDLVRLLEADKRGGGRLPLGTD